MRTPVIFRGLSFNFADCPFYRLRWSAKRHHQGRAGLLQSPGQSSTSPWQMIQKKRGYTQAR